MGGWLAMALAVCLIAPAARGQGLPLPAGVPGQTGVPGQPGAVQGTAFPADSNGDKPKDIKRRRRVRLVRPELLRYAASPYDSLRTDARRLVYWLETDTLALNGAWVQTLGLAGKPYQRFELGLPDYYLPGAPYYRDPVTNRPDAHIADPRYQLPFFDTRTPYVEAAFQQAGSNTQLFRFAISANVTPFVNVSLAYRRRAATGPVRGARTDHYGIALTSYFHNFSESYQGLASLSWHQLQDEINGGIRYEGQTSLDSAFAGTLSELWTEQGRLARYAREAFTLHRFRVLRIGRHTFELLAGARLSQHVRAYRDSTPPNAPFTAALMAAPFRPYGSLFITEPLFVFREDYSATALTAHGGLRYRLPLGPLFWTSQGEYELRQLRMASPHLQRAPAQTRHTLRYRATFTLPDSIRRLFRLSAQAELAANTLFGPEAAFEARLELGSRRVDYDVPDSIRRQRRARVFYQQRPLRGSYYPWHFTASALRRGQNPSIYDAFYQGVSYEAPTFGLVNETATRLSAALRHTRPPATRRGLAYAQTHYEAGLFFSSIEQPIWRDAAGQAQQGATGEALLWAGGYLEVLQRLGRFHFTGRATAQTSRASGGLPRQVALQQPELYGRVGIFYENKPFVEGVTTVRLGLEGWFFSRYTPLAFEASQQQWYLGAGLPAESYLRLDAIVAAEAGDAQFYIRAMNLLDGILAQGYFTTPVYPMWPRDILQFGVQWRFYD